jgi:hypothetical protein
MGSVLEGSLPRAQLVAWNVMPWYQPGCASRANATCQDVVSALPWRARFAQVLHSPCSQPVRVQAIFVTSLDTSIVRVAGVELGLRACCAKILMGSFESWGYQEMTRLRIRLATLLVLVGGLGLLTSGCGSSGLSASSTCSQFMNASQQAQETVINQLAAKFDKPDYATPLGEPEVPYFCASNPSVTLGQFFSEASSSTSGQQNTSPASAYTPPPQPAPQPTTSSPNAAFAAGQAFGRKAAPTLGKQPPGAATNQLNEDGCQNASQVTGSGAIPPYTSFIAGCVDALEAAGA